MDKQDLIKQQVTIVYTNWKGEKSKRHIIPKKIYFGSTSWHPEEQWLLLAFDIDKQEDRNFAIKDIEKWENIKEKTL